MLRKNKALLGFMVIAIFLILPATIYGFEGYSGIQTNVNTSYSPVNEAAEDGNKPISGNDGTSEKEINGEKEINTSEESTKEEFIDVWIIEDEVGDTTIIVIKANQTKEDNVIPIQRPID